MNHALAGTPFTISHYPKKFEGLLLEIQNHLPEYLKLPFDPKGVIWKLYWTLTCTTVLPKGRFLVIPLLDNMNTFEIFNIFHMPVPVKDPVVPTDKLPSMVAWYRLETSSIPGNLAQMKYVLLTATEQEHCTSPLWHYCDVRSPVYSMISSKLCIVALFMKDTENAKNNCKTEVEPNSILPKTTYHIIDGLWFIATQNILCSLPSETKRDSDCKPTFKYNQTKHVLYCYI